MTVGPHEGKGTRRQGDQRVTGQAAEPVWPSATPPPADPALSWDLREIGELDAPEVARRLLADHPAAGASPAAVVAKAAVDFCEAYGVAVS